MKEERGEEQCDVYGVVGGADDNYSLKLMRNGLNDKQNSFYEPPHEPSYNSLIQPPYNPHITPSYNRHITRGLETLRG